MKQTSELKKAVDYVRSISAFKAKIAIILGSGLGSFADSLDDKLKISTEEIPNYPTSTVQSLRHTLCYYEAVDSRRAGS